MASNHEDTLQGSSVNILVTNSTKLVEWLRSDRHILHHARSDGIIDERVYNQLISTPQPEDACIKLINRMINGGEGTSSQFLKLLKKTEILNTYPQLKQWNSSFVLPGPPEPKITNSLSVPGASPAQTMTKTQEDRFAEEKLRSGRNVFIQGVSDANLNPLLDELLLKKVINEAEMESVRGEKLRSEKARQLIDMVRRKGNKPCSKMIDIVCQLEPELGELLHQPSPADQMDRPTTHNNGFTGAGSTQKPPEMTVSEPKVVNTYNTIYNTVSASNERHGVPLPRIANALAAGYGVKKKQVKLATKRLENKGMLFQAKNFGMPSYKVANPFVKKHDATKKPKAKKPAANKPAVKKPVVNKPVANKPVANKPAVKKPVVNKPVANKPVANKPAVKKPAAKKPAAKNKKKVTKIPKKATKKPKAAKKAPAKKKAQPKSVKPRKATSKKK